MKKLLTTLTLMFFFNISFSQSKTLWHSYRNEVGVWDSYKRDWEFGEMNQAYIPIFFGQQYIKLENKSQSFFSITEDKGETTEYSKKYPWVKITTHEWLAIDKDNRKCLIMLSTTSDTEKYDPIVLMVMYTDFAFRYYCKLNEIDSFSR
jgi:hypothetical protein